MIGTKYRVERRIGEGGMGIVIAARHLDLGTRVALKLMRGKEGADQTRFLREAQAASRASRASTSPACSTGRTGSGTPYLVMEYLNGKDLARALAERGALPVATAVDYVLQASEAIAEAHALGIVHRDLEPSNLFLVSRRDGTELVKVLDFGISKITRSLEDASRDITVTDASVVMGSIAYMSPEQLQASTQVDARSDIWSIGVVLHELVTGKRPFDGESAASVGARIAAAEPIPLRRARPDAPAGLEVVVSRCLEKNPARRFPDLADLAGALAPFGSDRAQASIERVARLAGSPAVASASRSRSPVEPARTARRRWPMRALGVVAFAGGIAGVRYAVAPVAVTGGTEPTDIVRGAVPAASSVRVGASVTSVRVGASAASVLVGVSATREAGAHRSAASGFPSGARDAERRAVDEAARGRRSRSPRSSARRTLEDLSRQACAQSPQAVGMIMTSESGERTHSIVTPRPGSRRTTRNADTKASAPSTLRTK